MSAAVAIKTWALTWPALQGRLRKKLGSKRSTWLDQARLLRVMPLSHGHAWNVQQHFCNRRGKNLLLSPLDWLLIEFWAGIGIGPEAISRGIDAVFDRRDRGRQFQPHHQVNSLSFCGQEIVKEARMMAEASVGSRPARSTATPHTLLLALPPAGKVIFAAWQAERQLVALADDFSVGLAYTVYPDDWHRHEARERFGIDLEFLDREDRRA